MEMADNTNSDRENRPWALKALAQASCARKTGVSSQARAATSTTSRLQGMTHAHFVRSPHAHAKVKSIDSSAAMKMPGVVGVLTGQQIVDDKVGNLICGWAITSKDGTPMKMGAWPAMAPETVRFVGQAVAVVIAETKNQAKRRRGSRRRRLRGASRRGRYSRRDQAGRAAAASGSAGQRGLRLGASATRPRSRTPSARPPMWCRSKSPITGWCRMRWSRARRSRNTTKPKSISRSTPHRKIRMSPVWCCRPSTTSRRSTSCGWWRPMSAAASARRSSSIRKRWWRCGPPRRCGAR